MTALRLAAAVLIFTSAGVAHAAATSGKLTRSEGMVFVRAPGGQEAPAQLGAVLTPGTQIRTEKDGNAEVQFDDGSILRVTPQTSLVLSPAKRQQAKKSSILLFFGKVWSKVARNVQDGNHYEVSTPNAVCGVRGTEFTTQVGDDGSLRMQVSEGQVAVEGDGKEALAGAGQQVEANEQGVESTEALAGQKSDDAWRADSKERLRTQGAGIVESLKGKIMSRKDKLEKLRAEQKAIEARRKKAEERARVGDKGALDEIRGYNQELARLADAIADIGDEAQAQLGIVDHFADLAGDPRFKMVNRKTIEAEAASLRRVKAMLDQLVAEGTDISIEAMDQLLDDMSGGKRGTLKDKKGSSTKDLFGDDNF